MTMSVEEKKIYNKNYREANKEKLKIKRLIHQKIDKIKMLEAKKYYEEQQQKFNQPVNSMFKVKI